MVHINLLPVKEIKQKVQARQQVVVFSVVFVGLVICLIMGGVIHAGIVSGLERNIIALNNEKTKYNQVLAEIEALKNQKQVLQTRIDVITGLSKEADLTVRVMDEVARATPNERVWLHAFSQQGGSLTLQGTAMDNRTIASYMDALKSSSYITQVNLSNSMLTRQAGKNLKTFSLSCRVSPPAVDPTKITN